MNHEIIIIIILSIVVFLVILAFIGYVLYSRKKQAKSEITTREKKIFEKEQETLKKDQEKLSSLIKSYDEKLMNLNNLDQKTIKHEVINKIKKDEYQLINQEIQEIKNNAKMIASNILIETMQSLASGLVQDNSIMSIEINDDQIKGRIIGREGRNKKAFEMITGTELVIDKESNCISISSHNPIRREIAKQMLEKLIKSKVIEPGKIELLYQEIKTRFDEELKQIGKQVVEQIFDIHDLNQEIYPFIGRMKYRSSYGQNSLNHIIECAQIAKAIAHALGLEEKQAIKCALLHDIGKSVDYELNANHVDVGSTIAKNFNLDKNIINAIESHHGSHSSDNIYSEITKIADTISASRPGARINSTNEYFERVQILENIINEFEEVNYCYALKAGRYIRVIVNPLLVHDYQMVDLAHRIKQAIETNEITKGYNIKVSLIKENKYEFETNNKNI